MATDINMAEQEIWEIQVPGSVFVAVRDPRVPGAWKTIRANGTKGPRRLTLTVEERMFNQDQIPEESRHHDPFTNGALRCVQGSPPPSRYWLTDEDLAAILELDSDEVFEEAVRGIEIELPLRRLLDLAQRVASIPRYELIKTVIEERYAVGGTQRSVREMVEAGEKLAGWTVN